MIVRVALTTALVWILATIGALLTHNAHIFHTAWYLALTAIGVLFAAAIILWGICYGLKGVLTEYRTILFEVVRPAFIPKWLWLIWIIICLAWALYFSP